MKVGLKTAIALVTVFLIMAGCLTSETPQMPEKTTTTTPTQLTTTSSIKVPSPTPPSKQSNDDMTRIDEIHMDLDGERLDELKEIILSDKDDYTRERALFIFSDISLKEDEAEEAISFLKEVAAADPEMRTGALANLDFIREENPFETNDALKPRVEGDIKPGSQIKVILEVSSSRDSKGEAGINQIGNLNQNLNGISSSDITPVEMGLRKGEVKEISYDLNIDQEGEYVIGVFLKLSLDRWDSMIIRKTIYLKVGKDAGVYEVIEGEV